MKGMSNDFQFLREITAKHFYHPHPRNQGWTEIETSSSLYCTYCDWKIFIIVLLSTKEKNIPNGKSKKDPIRILYYRQLGWLVIVVWNCHSGICGCWAFLYFCQSHAYIGTSNLTDLFDLHRGNRSVPSFYAKVSMIVCRWILALPVGLWLRS